MKIEFTTLSGNTFTTNEQGNYFYMIDAEGKKIRIKKAEFESARKENNEERRQQKINEAWNEYYSDKHEEAQAELDKEPCFVDPNDPENAYPTDPELEQIKEEIPGIEDAEAELERNIRNESKILDRIATKVADRVVEYEHSEDAKDREDAFNTPNDVKGYARDFGWLDDINDDMADEVSELDDSQINKLEKMITNKVIALLFPKKAAKPRRPRDVAHESNGITLTAKQVDFIRHLPDTCFWEHGVDSEIWVDCLCDDIGGQFEQNPMAVGAMISTLCEKGLGIRSKNRVNGRKCTGFALTELGKKIAVELGL